MKKKKKKKVLSRGSSTWTWPPGTTYREPLRYITRTIQSRAYPSRYCASLCGFFRTIVFFGRKERNLGVPFNDILYCSRYTVTDLLFIAAFYLFIIIKANTRRRRRRRYSHRLRIRRPRPQNTRARTSGAIILRPYRI